MGGEKEMTVEKKDVKVSGDKVSFGSFRIHQNNGEVHVHDDSNKLKVAVPVAAWWKMWDRLRNETGLWTWIDPVNKTKLTLSTQVQVSVVKEGQLAVDVNLNVTNVDFSADWEKINSFSKRK